MEDNPLGLVLKLAILLFSVSMHEFAHGYMAYRLGDPTAKLANRLTLNPLAHIDLWWTIVFPLLLLVTSGMALGAAKPVPVNPAYFRHPRRDDILVSVAGVSVNFAIAAVSGLLYRILAPYSGDILSSFLVIMCLVNVGLAVFNMLPIPPLDGSHVLAQFLPRDLAMVYARLAPFGFIILLVLSKVRLLDYVMSPLIWMTFSLLTGLGIR